MNRTETPVRTCIGCRGSDSVSHLYRIALEEEQPALNLLRVVLVDSARSLPGRGAWLHPNNDCFELARKKRAFARAFRIQGELDLRTAQEFFAAVSEI